MIEYIKQVLPRIQNASKKLDHKEVFVDKPWVMLKEGSPELLEYEFLRDGRLLVSNGGEVTWGNWELTPSSQKLIMTYGGKSLLIKHAFIDDALMIIKLSGNTEPSMLFINSQKIPDLNYTAYLDAMLSKVGIGAQKVNALSGNYQTQTVQVKEVKEKYNISFSANEYDKHGNLINGYVWNGKSEDEYWYYENGKYKAELLLRKYNVLPKGSTMLILQHHTNRIVDGDIIKSINGSMKGLSDGGTIALRIDTEFLYDKLTYNKNGVVIKFESSETKERVLIAITVITVLVLIYTFLFSHSN